MQPFHNNFIKKRKSNRTSDFLLCLDFVIDKGAVVVVGVKLFHKAVGTVGKGREIVLAGFAVNIRFAANGGLACRRLVAGEGEEHQHRVP